MRQIHRHGNLVHRYIRGILAWRRGSSDQSSAQRHSLQVLQCHPRVAKGASTGTLARRPLPQVPQWHPRVAKHSSDRSSARRPSTEALLGQGRVPKERESLPLQGLWSSLRPGLARHPRLQIVLRQGRVAKRASIGTLARLPLPTDASVASSRSHCALVYRIVALLGFVKFTWNEPLLIIK